MLTPAQMSTSFFKIQQDQPITFVWNFTSLYRQPEHLTLNVVGADKNNFPVGPTDGIIPGTQTSVVWDPYAYNQAHRATPLVQQEYQLQIWDDKGSNAPIAPGLFAMNTQVKFALYSPAPYTPLASGESPAIHVHRNLLLTILCFSCQDGNALVASLAPSHEPPHTRHSELSSPPWWCASSPATVSFAGICSDEQFYLHLRFVQPRR
jgi:hypothetical protein